MSQYLNLSGLQTLWNRIKEYAKITTTSGTTKVIIGSNEVTIPDGISPYDGEIQRDGTESSGSSNSFARGDHVHPTDTTRVEANNAITGATKTKITYDSKGLVTAGADLAASDIPNLTLSKITDVTASAAELNTLDGITATTAELNILDGVTATATELNVLDGITATTTELNYVDGVTSAIQTQLNSKADSSSSVSTVTYDTTNKKITKTINSSSSDVVTAATIVSDGGALLSSTKGAANGVCPLDANQKVPADNLPSYVDDVVEAYPRTGQTALSSTWLATGSASGTVITPESGVIYILMTGTTDYPQYSEFRFGGTTYVKINDGGMTALSEQQIIDNTPLT